MSSGVDYAVIIGINDYGAFDASTGNTPGTSNLRGAVNDARLYLHLARKLGVPAENTRVLVAPAGGGARPDTFDGVEGGAPTEANIRATFQWLVDELKANPGKQAILSYSGHGDSEDGHLVLCPTDMAQTKDGLAHAINLSGIGDVLDPIADSNLITVFLDCCHSGSANPAQRALRSLETPVAQRTRKLSNGHPVIAACNADALSAEVRFGGTYFGAFSWSITQVIERWQEEGDSASIGLAYGEAPRRSSMLMSALGIEQTPVYEGAAPQAFARLFTRADRDTAPPPAAPSRELFPGDNGVYRIYYLYDDSGHHFMSVLATGPNYTQGGGYAPNMEYYTWTSSAVSKLQNTSAISFVDKYTASSSSSKAPADKGFNNLGLNSTQVAEDKFLTTGQNQTFSFNSMFTRSNGTTAIGFVWSGASLMKMHWFHRYSELVFSSSGSSLSHSDFYKASKYYISQSM